MQALFFIFCHLHKLCKRHFLHFAICIGYASIKTFVFTFAERRCVFGMVGAAPVCPPERPRSGVSTPKIHAWSAGNERRMRPCRATRAGTQAPPLPISIIFFHTILHKPNNHLHAIHPNDINRPTRNPPKRIRRGGACVPARTSAQRRFHNKNTRIMSGG